MQDAERMKRLFAAGSIAAAEHDRSRYAAAAAEADAAAALAAVKAAEHELENARAALGVEASRTSTLREVLSPVDGQILRVLQASEGLVAGGTPVVEVGSVERLEVVVPLLTKSSPASRRATRSSSIRRTP